MRAAAFTDLDGGSREHLAVKFDNVEPDGDLRPGLAVPAFGLDDDDLGSIK